MDRLDEARQAYQLAVSSLSQEGSRPYLNMKLADLTFSLMDKPGEGALEVIDEEPMVEEPMVEERMVEELVVEETVIERTVVEESIEDTAEKAISSPEEEE
jgi:hypothetical protein